MNSDNTNANEHIEKSCSCGKINEQVYDCELCHPKKVAPMTGWLCPACGRGNSPFNSTCPCISFTTYPTYCGVNQPNKIK